MVSKSNINFFYLAGSVVGGFAFLSITVIYVYLAINIFYPIVIEEGILLELLDSSWGAFLFFCISFMFGIVLSNFSVNRFYYRAKDSKNYKEFNQKLSSFIGVNIPESDDKDSLTYLGQIKSAIAFSNNVGHPYNLYDFAGRARLIGSSTLCFIWLEILSILLLISCFFFDPTSDISIEYFRVMIATLIAVLIINGFLIRICYRESIRVWISFLKRIDIFSIYQYKDDVFEETDYLKKCIQKAESYSSESNKNAQNTAPPSTG